MSEQDKKIIVTTSWDDGNPLDLKLAEMLRNYGIAGTFYVPRSNAGMPLLAHDDIRWLHNSGMEIGAHTLTHAVLPPLHPARMLEELKGGKAFLENVLGGEVSSFCYPKGEFSRSACAAACQAGYRLARTTLCFRVAGSFDPFRMPTSLHLYPHSRAVLFRHALKEGNLSGLLNWIARFGCDNDLSSLIRNVFNQVCVHGGIFHLWGHSWEVEQLGLWPVLEDSLCYISRRPGVLYLTNAQVLDSIQVGHDAWRRLS